MVILNTLTDRLKNFVACKEQTTRKCAEINNNNNKDKQQIQKHTYFTISIYI